MKSLAISLESNRVIAVTDREDYVLAVRDVSGVASPNPTASLVADAISKAGAAAFLICNH